MLLGNIFNQSRRRGQILEGPILKMKVTYLAGRIAKAMENLPIDQETATNASTDR